MRSLGRCYEYHYYLNIRRGNMFTYCNLPTHTLFQSNTALWTLVEYELVRWVEKSLNSYVYQMDAYTVFRRNNSNHTDFNFIILRMTNGVMLNLCVQLHCVQNWKELNLWYEIFSSWWTQELAEETLYCYFSAR